MECIICQNSDQEPIQDNTSCPCKYKYHASCWIDYVHSKNTLICPMCRRDITAKPVRKASPTFVQGPLPYTPQLYTVSESHGGQSTYLEFIDTLHQNTPVQVTPITPIVEPAQKQSVTSRAETVIKIIMSFGILITVITLILIFL